MPFSNVNPDWRVMGVDPGTDTMGYAILDYDSLANKCFVNHADTIVGSGGLLRYRGLADDRGDLKARLMHLENTMYRVMNDWDVDAVVVELPFVGRNIKTYDSLKEAYNLIERASSRHNPDITMKHVTPRHAKEAVGSDSRSKDKELVTQGILNTDAIVFRDKDLIGYLDEHAWDAIAVGFTLIKTQLI